MPVMNGSSRDRVRKHTGIPLYFKEFSSNNTTDDKFKKAYQVVGRPATTDHDINEDFLRDPPQNEPGRYWAIKDGREHDLKNKYYTKKQSEDEVDAIVDEKERLEKRRNPAQISKKKILDLHKRFKGGDIGGPY